MSSWLVMAGLSSSLQAAEPLCTDAAMPVVQPAPSASTLPVSARRSGSGLYSGPDDSNPGSGTFPAPSRPRPPRPRNPRNAMASNRLRRKSPHAKSVHVTDYQYRYLDALTGRWTSPDPIGEDGGVNLYGFVGNNGVDRWDYLGKIIQTDGSGESQAYRNLLITSLEKITTSTLCWNKDKKDKTKVNLVVTISGDSGEFLTLTKGIDSPTLITISNTGVYDNAHANNSGSILRKVEIRSNLQFSLHVEPGRPSDSPYEKKVKYYPNEDVEFPEVLWHELGGHAILGLNHPDQPWNNWNTGFKKDIPSEYGVKVDPTVAEENKARTILGRRLRAPFYYGWKAPMP